MYNIIMILITISVISNQIGIGSCHKSCPQGEVSETLLLEFDLECFIAKYNPDVHDGHKLQRTINQRLTGFKKIRQHLKMRSVKPVQTSPVVKWAQNQEQIFINFKLSHRQDTPPCSDISYSQFRVENITNVTGKQNIIENNYDEDNATNSTSMIDFEGQCLFTNQKFKYNLKMVLNASLVSLNIEKEGFGSFTLIGVKKQKGIWIDPFEEVNRAAIWAQLRDKYSKDMDSYFKMREERKQQNQSKKAKKKKRRRPATKHSQIKNQHNTQEKAQVVKDSDASQASTTDL